MAATQSAQPVGFMANMTTAMTGLVDRVQTAMQSHSPPPTHNITSGVEGVLTASVTGRRQWGVGREVVLPASTTLAELLTVPHVLRGRASGDLHLVGLSLSNMCNVN